MIQASINSYWIIKELDLIVDTRTAFVGEVVFPSPCRMRVRDSLNWEDQDSSKPWISTFNRYGDNGIKQDICEKQ